MKLVACPQCHAQFDVSQSSGPTISCRCGATIKAEPPAARDATVTRFAKPTFTKPAPIDLRHEIATTCDVVIEALAD